MNKYGQNWETAFCIGVEHSGTETAPVFTSACQKKKKNPESYYYAILVVSQRLCLSTVPAFALYMCHPFHCAFLMKLSQASTMRKTHERKFVVKLYCGFLSLQLDAMSLPLSLSLPTETCGINTPYVSSSFLVQLCLTKVHLKRIYKKARDCVF